MDSLPETSLISATERAARAVESLNAWSGVRVSGRQPSTVDEVAEATATARQAMADWAARPPRERSRILRRFARRLYDARHSIARLISEESGKPVGEGMISEVAVVLDSAMHCARRAERLSRTSSPWMRNPALWRKRVRLRRVPVGVVAVIAPWNYPFMLAAGHILPALVMGNAVVFKPSEYTPACGEALVDLLHQAGIPRAVLQLLHGDGYVGDALARSGVDFVCFTGSEAAGAHVARACGEMMIRSSLELGGIDAAIVLDDASPQQAARGLVWGRCMNAGQSCVAPKRIFATPGIYEQLTQSIVKELQAIRVGDPADPATDVGGLVRRGQADVVRDQLRRREKAGAVERAAAPAGSDGAAVVAPRLLVEGGDVSQMDSEIFGPVLVLRRVASVDEAVQLANASVFGLSASVWGGSRSRVREVANRLEAGTVMINDVVSVVGIAEVPHGGVKRSGYGRMHGDEALLECTRTFAVIDDRLPSASNPWWFPYSQKSRDDVALFIGLSHGPSLWAHLQGAFAGLRLILRSWRRR
jgi:acyl-CoA reductase-like NAD-dependent aldehyde dehydrogenase